MICVAATNPFGYDALAANWLIANDIAAQQGRTMDPARLRLVGPMHIVETRAKAYENVRFGFERYLGYLNNNQPRFSGDNALRIETFDWCTEHRDGLTEQRATRVTGAMARPPTGREAWLLRVIAYSPKLAPLWANPGK